MEFHRYILNGLHKNSLKTSQKGNTHRNTEREQSYLYGTHQLNLIHIATKFHQDISNDNPVMAHTISHKLIKSGKSKNK